MARSTQTWADPPVEGGGSRRRRSWRSWDGISRFDGQHWRGLCVVGVCVCGSESNTMWVPKHRMSQRRENVVCGVVDGYDSGAVSTCNDSNQRSLKKEEEAATTLMHDGRDGTSDACPRRSTKFTTDRRNQKPTTDNRQLHFTPTHHWFW